MTQAWQGKARHEEAKERDFFIFVGSDASAAFYNLDRPDELNINHRLADQSGHFG